MLVCAFLSYHILNMAHYQTLYATLVINLSSLWHHKVCRNLWGENMLIYWIYCICCNFFVNIFCPRVFSVWTVRKDFIIDKVGLNRFQFKLNWNRWNQTVSVIISYHHPPPPPPTTTRKSQYTCLMAWWWPGEASGGKGRCVGSLWVTLGSL